MFRFISRARFSKSSVEIVFIRDSPYGFEGQMKQVKYAYYEQKLSKGYAIKNIPGLRDRLIPDIDQETLKQKIASKEQTETALNKFSSLSVEFIRPARFANPNLTKEPISDQDILDELKNKYQIEVTRQDLNLSKKIQGFGTTVLNVQNYFSDELKKRISFPLKIAVRREKVESTDKKEKKQA